MILTKLTKEEKKILLEALCEMQIQMIMDDHSSYTSNKYKDLEKLKIKVNDEMATVEKCKHCQYEDDGK